MQAWGSVSCAELDNLEARALTYFEGRDQWNASDACAALDGWWLGVNPVNPAWTMVDGQDTLVPDLGPYPHELAHVLDWQLSHRWDTGCAHWNVTRPDLYAAIQEASSP